MASNSILKKSTIFLLLLLHWFLLKHLLSLNQTLLITFVSIKTKQQCLIKWKWNYCNKNRNKTLTIVHIYRVCAIKSISVACLSGRTPTKNAKPSAPSNNTASFITYFYIVNFQRSHKGVAAKTSLIVPISSLITI